MYKPELPNRIFFGDGMNHYSLKPRVRKTAVQIGTHVCFFVVCFVLFLNYLFIYLWLGLRFCVRAFSSCGERGPPFIAVRGPLLLRSTDSRHAGPAIVALGPSRSAARGIPPDQGPNPRSLHWQADSQPLRHQGSPHVCFVNRFLLEHSLTHSFTYCL